MATTEYTEPTEPKELSAEDIFASDDRKVVVVTVPEWGGIIRLRQMSALDLIKFQNDTKSKGPGADEAFVRGLVVSAVKADGVTPIFSISQLNKLKEKSFAIFNRLQDEILKLNEIEKTTRAAEAKND